MKARPMHDRILVKRDEPQKETAGGIQIPQSSQERMMQGTVVAVGKGRVDERGVTVLPSLRVGDRIVVGKYGGTEITIDGKQLWIMREDEILMVIE